MHVLQVVELIGWKPTILMRIKKAECKPSGEDLEGTESNFGGLKKNINKEQVQGRGVST